MGFYSCKNYIFVEKKESGFTILEIVIATVIIVTAFLPIMSLMQASDRAYKKSDNNAVAYNLAMEALEWARSIPFDRLKPEYINHKKDGYILPIALKAFKTDKDTVNGSITGINSVNIGYSLSNMKYFSGLKREMTITPIGTDGRVKLVTVTVSWNESNGKNSVHREEVEKSVVVDTRPF